MGTRAGRGAGVNARPQQVSTSRMRRPGGGQNSSTLPCGLSRPLQEASPASLSCPVPPGTTACSWWTRWHPCAGPPSTWTSKVRRVPCTRPPSPPLPGGCRGPWGGRLLRQCLQARGQRTRRIRTPGDARLLAEAGPAHGLVNTPASLRLRCGEQAGKLPQHLETHSEPLRVGGRSVRAPVSQAGPQGPHRPVTHNEPCFQGRLAGQPGEASGPSVSSQKKVPIHRGWGLATATPPPLHLASFFQNLFLPGRSGPSKGRFLG